jgi:hypothetical protein
MSHACYGIRAFIVRIEAVTTAVRGHFNAPAVSLEH